ncbi:MAG: Na/Pi cotransporter family protein [Clostridia bacterium]|nr:Na/Pi cotransporter family protein [Clostridia bacterium]
MDITNIFGLLGGMGLFLFGMKLLSDGLELVAGSKMKRVLGVLTKNRVLAALAGIVVTALIQSSATTCVMTVGFVNAGLINLSQAIGIIMGANIGTTITGQLITFKMSAIAPIFIGIGVFLTLFVKKTIIKQWGQIITGLGMLFVGLSTMSTAMSPLGDIPEFKNLLMSFSNPLLGIVFGIVFTVVLQSSAAVTGILIALASAGSLTTLDNAIYILLGMNIGTCLTTIVASIGASKAARRTAVVHLLFNLIGTAIFIPIVMFLPYTDWIASFSGSIERQIANAHTIFNVATTLVLLPLGTPLAKLTYLIIPGEDKKSEDMKMKYIDERLLRTPPIAVGYVKKEVERLGVLARNTIHDAFDVMLKNTKDSIDVVLNNENTIDYIENELTKYMIRLSACELSARDSRLISKYLHVVNDLERVGDHAENVVEAMQKMQAGNLTFSPSANEELSRLVEKIEFLFDESLIVLRSQTFDKELDFRIRITEQNIDDLTREFRDNHVERLAKGKCSPEQGVVFVDLLINLERVADHACNIALNMEEI